MSHIVNLNIEIEEDLRNKLKAKAIMKNMTLKKYMEKLITEELK